MNRSSITKTPRLYWAGALALACLFAVTLIVVACSSGSMPVTQGMTQVKVTLTDPATCGAPNGPFAAVWITITDVQANVSSSAGSNDSGWVDLTPNLTKNNEAAQVNLLALAQSNTQCLLASLGDNQELQAGNYQQIRIILASSTSGLTLVNTNNPNNPTVSSSVFSTTDQCASTGAANCVQLTSDNTFHALQLSSEAQTGIKIPSGQIAGGQFAISAGQTKDLNIDFNTCASIVQEGNGQYRLKPVLHAGEAGTTSVSLNGTVMAGGAPVSGAVVSLEQPDSAGVDRILMSTSTASDGSWAICPVMVGDTTKPYDIVVSGTDANGVVYAPSIVTGVAIGSTAGTIQLNAPVSPLNTSALSFATLTGQVTSVNTGNAGTPVDATLTVLEQVGTGTFTIPLPASGSQTASANALVTTAPYTSQNPACNPTTADCVNYTLLVPSTGAYIGAWSSSGETLSQPAALGTYTIDGVATVSGSSSTPDCAPGELQSTPSTVLTGAGPFMATVPTLAFQACQ